MNRLFRYLLLTIIFSATPAIGEELSAANQDLADRQSSIKPKVSNSSVDGTTELIEKDKQALAAKKEADKQAKLAKRAMQEAGKQVNATKLKMADPVNADKPNADKPKAEKPKAEKQVNANKKAIKTIQDCPDCPIMVAIPNGSFQMGSEPVSSSMMSEERKKSLSVESPQHLVTIGAPFAMSATEITVRQFRYFVKDHDYHKAAKAKNNKYPVRNNGEYDMSAICGTFEEGMLEPDRKDRSWKNPGFDQTDSDPVVCVSWQDANAFTDWLSSKTNLSYSLPTEAEWEYAARGGTNSKQDADNPKLACEYGNVMDKAGKVLIPKDKINNWVAHECDDHFKFTAPTGSFKPNRLGFYDMIGNVWEWVKDSYHPNYNGAPDKGGEWNEGGSKYRVLRGGSWSDDANGSRVAARGKGLETMHNFTVGFRVVRACPNNSCNQ